jgi:hypothetical protein
MLAQVTSGVRLAATFGVAVSFVLPGFGAVSGAPANGSSAPAMGASGSVAGMTEYSNSAATTRQLRLTVLDLATGAPIRGARVTGYWYFGSVRGPLPTAVTNSAGVAVITGPAQPRAHGWRLLIEAPGYVSEPYTRLAHPGTDSRTIRLKRR